MTKLELASKVAQKAGITKKLAASVVDAVFGSIEEALASGEKVQIVGFGSFEVRQRKSRKGRNPRTGKEIKIPSKKVPAFRAGKGLKDKVAKK